jgi:hypothetical protein
MNLITIKEEFDSVAWLRMVREHVGSLELHFGGVGRYMKLQPEIQVPPEQWRS